MKGLLLKDLYMARKYCRSYLFIVGAFTIIAIVAPFLEGENGSTLFLSAYPILLAGIIPVNLIAYEEKSKWSQYAGIFPYTKKELVSVKYLDMLMALGIALVLAALSQGVNLLVTGSFRLEVYALILAGFLVMGLISPCILLPVIFWLGTEKGRVVYFAVVGLFFGGVAVSKLLLKDDDTLLLATGEKNGLLLGLAAGVLLMLGLSWRLSVWFCEKKEC